MSYVDIEFYNKFSGLITDDKLESKLEKASDQINSLTFNRIVGIGFDNLTLFQQDKIKKAVCMQTDFVEQYGEYISSPLNAFSAGSISVTLNNNSVKEMNGVVTSNEVYTILKQTGLCCLKV